MPKLRIFRLETKEGRGVFDAGLVHAVCDEIAREAGHDFYSTGEPDPYRHPGPSEDWGLREVFGDNGPGREFFYGCASLELLIDWFDSERVRRKLADRGVVVAVYEADVVDVVRGHANTVFRKANAVRVEERPVPLAK